MPEILRVLGNVVRIKTEPLGDAVERRRARITDAESGYFGLQEAIIENTTVEGLTESYDPYVEARVGKAPRRRKFVLFNGRVTIPLPPTTGSV